MALHPLLRVLPLVEEDPVDLRLPAPLVLLEVRDVPRANVEVDHLHLLVDVEHRLPTLPLHVGSLRLNLRERYLKGRPPKSRMINEDPETRAVGVPNGPGAARSPISNYGEILIRRSAELTPGVREEPMTVTVQKIAKAIDSRLRQPHGDSDKKEARAM